MDWLRQDSPATGDGGGRSFGYGSDPAPSSQDGGGVGGYYDDDIPEDDVFPYDDDDDDPYDDVDIPDGGTSMSQLYRDRGLDILSGGRNGFGAVQGVEKTGGGFEHRGSAADVKVPGVVGDAGVTMGGNFASNGNSNVGGGLRRSSARYSGGGGGGFGGIDYDGD